ncbi:VWA domain-containing protein [Clostridium perfringens]|uniref:VWA domain-containing protein n=1 Tax=Clostridium perfringens TaxID=1502 RepID=UPI000992D2EE|nr:VWA domain-containing protein [Clostridium perfringens]AQW24812.1 VWA domain-containing protein [Clostridium perfringens]EHK2338556.1 VWA domain-containing protein [Clostridium perfringens]EIF5084689.1 VWA domain-containing protein [Clostridium perfringens]MDH2340019.1 VWA domain-containing protein [Clostridium perfringens]MDN4737831.1 VWA domain-containing protein [Clostridium perfringens]
MKKFKSTKKYSFFVIVTILIISMVSMLVYGELNKEQFKVRIENSFSELKYGEQKEITYEINPNPIKFKDNVEKDVVLVLDTSQTVNRGKSYEKISEAAQTFVKGLLNGYKNLKIGIVSYNEKAEILHRFDNSANSINSDIKKCYDNYNIDSGNHLGTNVGDAFRLAISMLGKDVNANKEKIVIFMSNGKPNAYTGKFYKGPESTLSKEKISSLNWYEQYLYKITSLNGSEEELGKESLQQEENAMSNKIKDYEKYFYNPEGLDKYGEQNFQKRGLRIDKVNPLIYYEYRINNAKDYINEIYRGKSTYSVNVLPNKDDGANIISYYMGSEIGYAYSLKMAKEMKDFGISTYPIYFDNDGIDNNKKNNDTRENTMKLISKFAGNNENDGVTSVNTVYSNDITASLNDVFTNLDKNIKDSYSVNDAKLTINIPEGLEIESINYSGKTIKINKEDLNDGKYELPIDNLSYKLNEGKTTYTYNGKPLEIGITVKGVNTSGHDQNCTITGDIYSKSIEDGEKTDLPNLNINVKSGFQVEITVNDFIGNVGEKYDSNNIKLENNSFNFIQDTKRLIGDGNANISVKGMPEKSDEEYWIKTWFTKENSNEEINKEEFKLNNINSDIDLDNSHNLTYQSYNVNHLETTGDEDSWNDRNQVFKSKQGDTGFLPANKIAGETGDGVNRIFQYGEPLKLNSKRPVYVYGNSKYCELKKTGTYKEFYDHGKNIKFEVWTYKWKNWFGNIENYEVYKYKEKWLGLKGGKIIYVDNWMWKHKTIFYDEMTVDNINDNNKYPGFSYKEADKYWGYIKPKESGWYLFGTYSDDGSRFSITKDGKTYELSKSEFGLNKSENNRWHIDEISSNFKVHGSSFYSSFTPIHLDKDKYYPIQLEYFNWGGNGCFKLGYCRIDNYENNENAQNVLGALSKVVQNENYKYDKDFKSIFQQNSKHYINDNIINKYLNDIQWIGSSGKNEEAFTLYPSKSNEPADIADEVFEGKSGVKFPKENGIYTIHYEIITRKKGDEKPREGTNGTILQLGEYGKFEVKDLLDTSISVVGSNNQKEIYLNEEAKAVYKMNPNEIKAEDIIRDGRSFPKEIKLTEIKIDGMLPSGMKFDENNNPSINLGTEINGERKFSTDKLTDITYTLENGVYKGSELSKDVNVNIESNGPFEFKSSENKVGFKLNYEYKITNPMFEEFKGTSVSASEPTKIEKFGILDSSSSDNIKDSREGVQVVNGIPLKIAILADVKSPNSIIDLGFNSQNIKLSKDTEPQFKIKIYNKGNLINCEKEFTIDKLEGNLIEGLNSGIKISGLDVGEKVIVIELIPNNIEINNSALLKTKVENSNDKEHLAKLDYAEMPDVF